LGHHFPEPTSRGLRAHFRDLLEVQLPRLERAGIRGYVALGVHPRAIPRRGLTDVLATLPALFRGGRVVALGEVGFHRGGPDEEEALVEQLQLARRLSLRVVLHTPALDKERWTRRLLALLREHGPEPGRVLVEHASARTVPLILARGHWAGLTVNVGELTADRAVQLVRRLGSRRLTLGSDAGDRPGDLLGLPRAVHLLERAGLGRALVSRLAYGNARRFFGVE
ncbi:MAG TPA: TatD family hydrolase, partial [Myxococcaceae bacterium]|nr:TatD family hydrolase [Myxococcaceae bacterium]